VQVVVAALAAGVQAVQTFELSQVPVAQAAVQVSIVPATAPAASAPSVFFVVVAAAQAETRESVADVQV